MKGANSKKSVFIFLTLILTLTIVKAQSSNNGKTDSKNCGCEYFPVCNTDLIKVYNGKEYRGVRDIDESIRYYNCENGQVRMLWQSKKGIVKMDGDGYYYDSYEYISNEKIIFDPGFPLNEEWSKELPGNMKHIYKNIQKNISVVIGGKQYTNVYIVQFSIAAKMSSLEFESNKENYPKCSFSTSIYGPYIVYSQKLYYAKGVGLIKTEDILPQLYLDHLKSQFAKDPNSVSNSERSVIQGKEFYDKFIAEQKGTTKLITSHRWKLEGYLKTDQSLSPSSSNRKYVTFTDNNLMYRHESFTQKIEESNPEIYFYFIVNDTLKYMPEFFGSLKSHGPQAYFKNYFERPTIYRFELTKYGDWGEVLKLFYFSPSAQKFESESEIYRKISEN